MKCLNCKSTQLHKGFLSNEHGTIYVSDGEPTFKNQLISKKKAITTYICNKCGYMMPFSKDEK